MTCTWEADFTGIQEKWDAVDADIKERALLLATSSLQMLTNNRVGTCPITIRPCPQPLPCANWEPYRLYEVLGDPSAGFRQNGAWLNTCGCRSAHWCAPLYEVDLPGPVGYVDTLKVDGVEVPLDDGNWRLDNGHLLVWQGFGPSPIPVTQDLNKADSEVGTWSVSYSQSYPVGADAKMAVAWLALEYAAAFAPKGKCSLPRGVTSVVRSGVSFSIEAGLFPNGLTGIDIADEFILKWTPLGSPAQTAVVFNPRDRHRSARVTSAVPTRPVTP